MTEQISDAAAAAAFRRLVTHLQHRHDAENIDLMGLAGFCRNCLADWVMEATVDAGGSMTRDEARAAIHGMPANQWKQKIPDRSNRGAAQKDEGKRGQKRRRILKTGYESE